MADNNEQFQVMIQVTIPPEHDQGSGPERVQARKKFIHEKAKEINSRIVRLGISGFGINGMGATRLITIYGPSNEEGRIKEIAAEFGNILKDDDTKAIY